AMPSEDAANRVLAHSAGCVAIDPPRRKHVSEFKVTLARIEVFEEGEQGKQVCAVFHIERGPIGFHIPIYLQGRDFDDTEVVQAARNSLYRMFAKLANQSKVWDLSPAELERLSKMNLRPVE
ncbi:MAG: hypothetical protein WB822_05000, partial [Rhodoplanes sp.]